MPLQICETCKKEFHVAPSKIKQGKGKYCSKVCTHNNPGYYAKICNNNKERGNNPEERKLRSQRMKEVWSREGYKESRPDAAKTGMTGKHHSDETKQKMRKSHSPMTEETKQKLREKNGGKLRSEETKQKIKQSWTPERRLKQSERRKGNKLTEETKQKLRGERKSGKRKPWSKERRKKASETMKRIYQEKDLAEKARERMLGANNPNWRGGIGCTVQYCEKFNKEFKRRCRAYFDYTCVECGQPENGHGHICHHVNYDKQICCNEVKPLFVVLCQSCHSKTNYNRDMWQRYFTEMTEGYYGSKCFLSKEEYKQLTFDSCQTDHRSGD
jgi:hypothetical protein